MKSNLIKSRCKVCGEIFKYYGRMKSYNLRKTCPDCKRDIETVKKRKK